MSANRVGASLVVGQTDTATEGAGSVSVGTSSVQVAAANRARVEITICNDHASQVVYLGLGEAAVANKGVRLNAAGGSYTTRSFTGAINAIATGASTTVTFVEV